MMEFVLGGSLLFHSIHPLSYEVSVFVVYYSVPNFPILEFPHILSVFVMFCHVPHFPILEFPHIFESTRKSECSLTMFFPILVFSQIFTSIRVSHYTQTIWFPILSVSFILGVDVIIPKFSQLNTRRSFPPIKDSTFMRTTKQRGSKMKERDEDYD